MKEKGDMTEPRKKVRRRKDDYSYISFVLSKELKEQFDNLLNERKCGITKFLTDCIELSVKTGKLPSEFSSPPQESAKSNEELKSEIDTINAKIDLLIKLMADK